MPDPWRFLRLPEFFCFWVQKRRQVQLGAQVSGSGWRVSQRVPSRPLRAAIAKRFPEKADPYAPANSLNPPTPFFKVALKTGLAGLLTSTSVTALSSLAAMASKLPDRARTFGARIEARVVMCRPALGALVPIPTRPPLITRSAAVSLPFGVPSWDNRAGGNF